MKILTNSLEQVSIVKIICSIYKNKEHNKRFHANGEVQQYDVDIDPKVKNDQYVILF